MTAAFRALRLSHWIKNVFVLLPAFFAGVMQEPDVIFRVVLAGLCFCCAASAVYIFNDYRDVRDDRIHPEKSKRPLAAGSISISVAAALGAVALAIGVGIALWLDLYVFWLVVSYVVLNVSYSLGLKKIPILDITLIAGGFLLRVVAGGEAAGVPVSQWLILMTFLLALFLALGKRRDDVLIKQTTGERMRKSVDGYNLDFINSSMVLMAAVVIVCYIMYTESQEVIQRFENENLYMTAIFVIVGLLRYLQISLVEERSGSPTRIILTDHFIQLTLVAWLFSFYYLLYM